ncbi:amino acid transporter [Aureimonas altamirensis]|uniref:Amino acid transporter n=1 Tax=Aureimonas altamirensis TaxID=370622 RepID=A0A0B1Q239_9HYPH|nr:LysE/ArgO family amino acid transporter [Aureimonas altamirensis]KHJ54858.1 amino acid transporter [Aureimonas altamirensis]
MTAYLNGLLMGLSLIVAIGAQNAFVLRQGLRNEHVLAVALTCALSDAALIWLGVLAFARVAELMPALEPAMRYAGAAFLVWYGCRSMLSAFRSSEALVVTAAAATPLWPVLATCFLLTFANPHVYLDTVVLLGSLSTGFPGQEAIFAMGATTASFLFFFSLGFGARFLRPVFANPTAWRILEGVIALVMWTIAINLLRGI